MFFMQFWMSQELLQEFDNEKEKFDLCKIEEKFNCIVTIWHALWIEALLQVWEWLHTQPDVCRLDCLGTATTPH